VLPRNFDDSVKRALPLLASVAAFRCLAVPSKILVGSRIKDNLVPEGDSVSCQCERHCMRRKPCGGSAVRCDRSFLALASFRKMVSKAMKSTSVKLSTNRDLALLR